MRSKRAPDVQDSKPASRPTRVVVGRRWRIGVVDEAPRTVAEEAPVAIVHDGSTTAVLMATPADLEDLATGFTLTEGIVDDLAQITSVEVVEGELGIEARVWLAHDAGALCFVDAEFRLFARPFEIDGVVITWGRALRRYVDLQGRGMGATCTRSPSARAGRLGDEGRIRQEALAGFDKAAGGDEAVIGGAVAACQMLHHRPNRRTEGALEVDKGAILVEQDRTDRPDLPEMRHV